MTANLPTIAERVFALRCGEAGVSCNRSSDQDDGGWDYVIQFPPDATDARPRDEQPAGQTAFVQVKSTGKPPFKVQLKLSNALRMAKERTAFFLVLAVGSGKGQRLLARHFWAQEIEHTLRRVRQAEAAGNRTRLHKRSITLALLDSDDHTSDLLEWMRTTIQAVRGDYHAAKALIADTVGFGKDAVRISAKFSGPREALLDWELGIGPSPTISDFKIFRERFGIELPDSTVGEGAKLSVEPVGEPCLVTLRHVSSGDVVTLAGKFYLSLLAPSEAGPRPWRADFGCFVLTQQGGHLKGRVRLDFIERAPLARLKDTLTVATWSGSGEVATTLFVGGERADVGTLDFAAADNDDERRQLAAWVATLNMMVAAHPGVDPQLSISDLYDARLWLKRFHDLFASPTQRIDHPPSPDDDPTHFILYLLRCDVGVWSFFAIVRRPVAVDTIVDSRRTLYLRASELLEAYVLEGSWAANMDRVRRAYDRHVQAAGDPLYFWDLGDMEDWIVSISRSLDERAA